MLRTLLSVAVMSTAGSTFAAEPVAAETETLPVSIARYVAVDNVCAWPNLTKLADGTIVAVIHNRPAHGQLEGDVDCWASRDGELWERRGKPAPNEPHTIRMNVAAGLAKNGDLLVLCSGWTDVKQPERPKQPKFRDAVLSNWVCRSTDGGKTWTQHKSFVEAESGWTPYIPFGDIWAGEDGALHASCYGGKLLTPDKNYKTDGYRAWHFSSDDDGQTWRNVSVIGAKHNETDIFPLGGKRWLAAARIDAIELFRSDDDGATWQGPQRVTGRNEINAHLMRLADGRLLLSYGCRVKDRYGVLAKLSSDDGQTWGPPIRLVHSLESDCGYPSSVQRADGRIVTAYYAKRVHNHERYQMGTAVWEAPK
ncbi:MAG: exo-alpha-sialidase [Planctomycetales bacterium]|nr:exo-alpha-sialidase [Planctomycetales bacterium]MBN8628867.1 exo-alpha-sialidase [Planctomycetota bacterium]